MSPPPSLKLLPNASLKINITATTDAQTLCSFTHHNYFNLNGEGTICGHSLQIEADNYFDLLPNEKRIIKLSKAANEIKVKSLFDTL